MDLQFYVLLFTGQKQVHAFGSILIDRNRLCGLQDIRMHCCSECQVCESSIPKLYKANIVML